MTFHHHNPPAWAVSLAAERAELARRRALIERGLEQMLALLDELDGDPDLEPSLGSLAAHLVFSQEGWALGTADDREDEHDGSEEDGAE